MWPDLIQKAKDGGLDVIQTCVFWNGHEPSPGKYTFEGRFDLVKFIKLVQQAGLYVHLRIRPFVCAEWNFGKRKNIEALREIAAARNYVARNVSLGGGNHLQTMDISGLLDSTEYGKMKVRAKVKITDFKQRCYYAACDKCPSATAVEIGWEFECSRCQELRVSIPRAMASVMLYDKDAEVDAFVFGSFAEKLLFETAINCMHHSIKGRDSFLHSANNYLEGGDYVFVVRKKSVIRKKQDKDQYTITEIVSTEDAPLTKVDRPIGKTIDKGKTVVIESTPLLPMTINNMASSTGDNAVGKVLGELSSLDNLSPGFSHEAAKFNVGELSIIDEACCEGQLTAQMPSSGASKGDTLQESRVAHTTKGRRKLFLADESDDDDMTIMKVYKRQKE